MTPDSDILLTAILENSSNAIAAVDTEYRYILFNKRYTAGMKDSCKEEIKHGVNAIECLLSESDRISARTALKRALKGESFVMKQEFGIEPGKKKTCELNFFPLMNSQRLFGAALFIVDITDKVKIQIHEPGYFERSLFDSPGLNVNLLRAEKARDEYINELEKMIIKTSYNLRQPVAQIKGLAQLINQEKNSMQEVVHILKLFKITAAKLDLLTTDLTEFIHSCVKVQEQQKKHPNGY